MKINAFSLLLAVGLATSGLQANGDEAVSVQSANVVRTQAQVFGDAIDSSVFSGKACRR
jgi:hypothetical protein